MFLVLGFFNQAPARPPHAFPLRTVAGRTGPTRRETKFQTAQRTQLDNSSHPLHETGTCLLTNGLDGAGETLRILVNEACRIERTQHL
jgi:hypothetical protein